HHAHSDILAHKLCTAQPVIVNEATLLCRPKLHTAKTQAVLQNVHTNGCTATSAGVGAWTADPVESTADAPRSGLSCCTGEGFCSEQQADSNASQLGRSLN